MNVTNILAQLPCSVDWMVCFKLGAIRQVSSDPQIKSMYFLPQNLDLVDHSHVVLSSVGRFLAPLEGPRLIGLGAELPAEESAFRSLATEYFPLLSLLPEEEPDCLGFGVQDGLPPVLLHLKMAGEWGMAKALFQCEPDTTHYDLLRAVGVEYLGGQKTGTHYLASFRNYLPTHLHAGALSGYSRTGFCNEFFFRHGTIDTELETGLAKASEDRVAAIREKSLAALQALAAQACREPMAMICQPPPPEEPFPFGDLVPLGFALRALRNSSGRVASELRSKLNEARVGLLWPFHSGRLVTSTDSALILQALSSRDSVESLQRFFDGDGGYYPQLWSKREEPGKMLESAATRHWCQPDFATTCLVRSLREEVRLPCVTRFDYLEARFNTRAGLYFANPYLTDWALAEAIRNDADAKRLKTALRQEILATRNQDYSFGRYDLALSTSLAILALAAIGDDGRAIRLSQIRLIEMVRPDGLWPRSTPFYSTFIAPSQGSRGPQIIEIEGEKHELSLYVDEHRMIGTSLAALALSVRCYPTRVEQMETTQSNPHPRYTCGTVAEYVERFALTEYVRSLASGCEL